METMTADMPTDQFIEAELKARDRSRNERIWRCILADIRGKLTPADKANVLADLELAGGLSTWSKRKARAARWLACGEKIRRTPAAEAEMLNQVQPGIAALNEELNRVTDEIIAKIRPLQFWQQQLEQIIAEGQTAKGELYHSAPQPLLDRVRELEQERGTLDSQRAYWLAEAERMTTTATKMRNDPKRVAEAQGLAKKYRADVKEIDAKIATVTAQMAAAEAALMPPEE